MTSVELVVVPGTLGLLLSEPAHQNTGKTEVNDLAISQRAPIIRNSIFAPSTAAVIKLLDIY